MALPPSHDFEWTPTRREDQIGGRHPHINILDTVFVETIGGDLTVKIENNTESGLGIYSEAVEDKTQSLDDAEISYARLGLLILLRIKPYRETAQRFGRIARGLDPSGIGHEDIALTVDLHLFQDRDPLAGIAQKRVVLDVFKDGHA